MNFSNTITSGITAIIILVLTVFLAQKFTGNTIKSEWYKCVKPSFTPPNIVFPIMWTSLYVLLGVALYFALKSGNVKIVALLAIVLITNVLWCYAFFTKKNLKLALIIILIMIAATMAAMLITNSIIRWLLLPYLIWILFATALNIGALSNSNKNNCRIK